MILQNINVVSKPQKGTVQVYEVEIGYTNNNGDTDWLTTHLTVDSPSTDFPTIKHDEDFEKVFLLKDKEAKAVLQAVLEFHLCNEALANA